MEIDQISNSQINQLRPVEQSDRARVDKAQQASSPVGDKSKDALVVDISKSSQETRSAYSQSLEKSMSIIATVQIVQKSLDIQEGILRKIQDTFSSFQSQEINQSNLDTLKTEISKFAQQVQTVNDATVYKNQNLFLEQNFPTDFKKPVDIVSELSKDVSDLIIDDDFEKINSQISSGLSVTSEYKQVFQQVEDDAVQSAEEVMEDLKTAEQESQKANAKNFGKESNDFAKNTILSQMGYFLASQANANQDVNIKLLTLR